MTSQQQKVRCSCFRCGTSIMAIPGTHCSDCHDGRLEKHWANHIYVEDMRYDGKAEVRVTYSVEPIPGKHCMLHKERE